MRGEQLNLFEDKYNRIDAMMDQVPGFWAYHAGMADGDGSFKIKQNIYQLSLIDKNIIKELSKLYGVKITKPKKIRKHKQKYMVSLCSKNFKHFLQKIYPHLIEKKDVAKDIMKKNNIEIITEPDYRYPILNVTNSQLAWLAGYFDAEGCISFSPYFDKRAKNYNFRSSVTFTSTNLKVLRYVKRIMNRVFNRNSDKVVFRIQPKTNWIKRPYNEAPCWDLICCQMTKTHLFSKIYQPIIKVQRKIKKMDRLINYGKFCAQMRWTFGKINFKKNDHMRNKWLKIQES